MDRIVATLRTLGVLLGLWVVLAIVGIVAGVIPFETLGARAAGEADDASTVDAGPGSRPSADATVDGEATEADVAGETDDTDGPEETHATETSRDRTPRWIACASIPEAPSIAAGQIYGDGSVELVVGCAEGWHVFGVHDGTPVRVATLTIADGHAPPPDARPHVGAAVIGDVDDDGRADLTLPLAHVASSGATRGGALFWVPSDAYGGIREPHALAPIAAVDVTITARGLYAMNRTNALAQLPSEAWVFARGASPERVAAAPVGTSASALAAADLDLDGHEDIVALSPGRVDFRFGDGAGGFSREHTLEIEGAQEIALGDIDSDGSADVAVLTDRGLRWIRAGSVEGMEPRGIDGVSATVRELSLRDLNGDSKIDIALWDHPGLVVLEQHEPLAFVARSAAALTDPALAARRHVLTDLDSDGAPDDLALLAAVGTDEAPLELVLIMNALERRDTHPAELAHPIADSPHILRAQLP